MYTDKKLKPILDNAPYTDAKGKKYPRNYPKDEIADLHKVTETERPTDPALVVTGFHIDKKYNQVWDTRPKTDDELAQDASSELLAQIHVLESSITPRRLREALLTDVGKAWLTYVETQIVELREQL